MDLNATICTQEKQCLEVAEKHDSMAERYNNMVDIVCAHEEREAVRELNLKALESQLEGMSKSTADDDITERKRLINSVKYAV